jgi:outer membrane receptor protein involved in Fe transport
MYPTENWLEEAEDYLELSGNYQNFSFNLSHNRTDKEGYVGAPVVKQGNVRKADTTMVQLGYQTALSEQWSITGKLTYANMEVHLDFDGSKIQDRTAGSRQALESTSYEGEVNLLWQPSQTFNWSNGWYYRQAPKVSDYLDLPMVPNSPPVHQATKRLEDGENLATWAWFSQLNYSPNPRWKWIAGLRLEQTLGYTAFSEYGSTPSEYRRVTPHYDDQDVAVIPRLAAIYTPNEKHIFKWMYGKAISSPSFGQNAWNRVTPDLPPLEAEEIETLEFDYLTYFSPRYLMSFNLFHNRLQKLITRTTFIAPDGAYRNFLGNSGRWTTTGIELGLQAQPTKSLQLELSATYLVTEDPDYPDREPNYSPARLGQLKLGYQWTPTVTVGLTGYYVSSMESQFDTSLQNPDGSVGRRIGQGSDNYSVWNANLRFENWLTKGTFVNLHLYNLLDQEIRYPTFAVNRWADKGTLGWKRSVMVTVGYEF